MSKIYMLTLLRESYYSASLAFQCVDSLIQRSYDCLLFRICSDELHGSLYLWQHAARCELTVCTVLFCFCQSHMIQVRYIGLVRRIVMVPFGRPTMIPVITLALRQFVTSP